MKRTVAINEYLVEEFNKMLAAEGIDVRIVRERSRPRVVEDDSNVVRLSQKGDAIQC